MCYLKNEKEGNFPKHTHTKNSSQKVPVNLMTGNKNTDDRNLIE